MASRQTSGRGGRPPSQRQLRIGEMLRHALADIFVKIEWREPDLVERSITVTEVTISPDTRSATVYCMALSGEEAEAAIAALNRSANLVRGQLGREITLKFTPKLTFKLDTSFEEAQAIGTLLHSPRVAQDIDGKEDDDGQAP